MATASTIENDPAQQTPPSDGLSGRRRYVAILAISLGTMLSSIDNGSVSIALPTLAADLNIAPSSAVLVVTLFQLVLIMTVLPMAALGDRIGHRTLYQSGQLVFTAATLLCFFVHSLPQLMIIRALQALGAAATLGVSSALIRSIYPQSLLGRGIGFNTIVAATSASIAPTLGGLVLSVAPWPWLFATTVPIGLLSIIIGHKVLPNPQRRQQPYDVTAAIMCAAMFGFAVVGIESAVRGASLLLSSTLIALAVSVGFIFVRRESKQLNPILPIDLLRHRQIGLCALASLLANIGTMIVLLTLPFRLQMGYGYSVAEAGLILGAWPVVMMVAAPASGMLSDKVPAGWLASTGMAIAVVGMSCLAFLPANPDHFDLIWRIALSALGFGMFNSPIARQVIGSAPLERAAAAGALAQTTRMTGLVLGSTIAAALLAGGMEPGPVPPLVAATLALLTGLCCLGVLRSVQPVMAKSRRR